MYTYKPRAYMQTSKFTFSCVRGQQVSLDMFCCLCARGINNYIASRPPKPWKYFLYMHLSCFPRRPYTHEQIFQEQILIFFAVHTSKIKKVYGFDYTSTRYFPPKVYSQLSADFGN
jgi:hypothetical protein